VGEARERRRQRGRRPAVRAWTPVAIAATVALAGANDARAQALTKADYQAARKIIESDFRTARTGCEPMLGNVRVICVADVRGREAIALAELRAAYDPTNDSVVDVRIAKARAGLDIARARCDDAPAQRKAACAAEAEAAHGAALASPKAAAAPK
jgi:hypothetical protein